MAHDRMAGRGAMVALLAAGLLAGAALGLTLGWLAWPVTWHDTDPSDLRVQHQIDYVAMSADSFSATADEGEARRRLYELVDEDTTWEQVANLVERVAVSRARDLEPESAERIRALAAAAELPSPLLQEYTFPTESGQGRVALLVGLGVGALAAAVLILVGDRRKGSAVPAANEVAAPPVVPVAASPSHTVQVAEPQPGGPGTAWGSVDGTQEAPEQRLPTFGPVYGPGAGAGRVENLAAVEADVPPDALGAFDAEYILGNEDLDCSFTITSPEGDFLGECGMGVSDVVRFGATRGVDAFEVWLFDRSDVRTVAKVLVSESALANETLNARLSSKGELLLVGPDLSFVLETLSLRLTVILKGYAYVAGTPKSVFSHLAVSMVAESGDSIP
ncbi:MAG: hypothetical protein ACYC4R_01395 [Anaerolineae bacterium]